MLHYKVLRAIYESARASVCKEHFIVVDFQCEATFMRF